MQIHKNVAYLLTRFVIEYDNVILMMVMMMMMMMMVDTLLIPKGNFKVPVAA